MSEGGARLPAMDTHSLEIPPTSDEAPVATEEDVLSRVDRAVDPASRRRQSLWLFFLDGDGAMLPVVVPVDDVPDRPDASSTDSLCDVVTQVLGTSEPEGSVVMALTRPGPATVSDVDRAWHRALRESASRRGARIRMLCSVTPAGVRQLVPGRG